MVKLSINLPTRYRLNLQIVKRRKNLDDVSLLPELGKVLRTRRGNKLSRYFRHIFENTKIKRVFGINFVIFTVITSFLPQKTLANDTDKIDITKVPLVLTTEKGIQYPVGNLIITQGYRFYHPGIDIDGKTGDKILPIMGGKVESAIYSKLGYGNSIIIDHGNGVESLYAHLSKIEVREGQKVEKGTEIGKMGATGWAHGDHLHLEVHENGHAINPLTVLPR